MNLGVDQGTAPIVLAPHTLLAPATKKVVLDTALGGAWVNSTTQQVIRKGVDGITPGEIRHTVSIVEPPSPVLIRIVATSPTCFLNAIQ